MQGKPEQSSVADYSAGERGPTTISTITETMQKRGLRLPGAGFFFSMEVRRYLILRANGNADVQLVAWYRGLSTRFVARRERCKLFRKRISRTVICNCYET